MEGSSKLAAAVKRAAIEQELQNHQWIKAKEEYVKLDTLLGTITDKRMHQCMVPISKGWVNRILKICTYRACIRTYTSDCKNVLPQLTAPDSSNLSDEIFDLAP